MRRALLFALALSPSLAFATGKVLPFTRVIQEQDQWCWAGSSRSLLLFYGKDIPQCTLAEYARTHETFSDRYFGSTPCCVRWDLGCNSWNYMYGGAGSLENLLQVLADTRTDRCQSTFRLPLELGRWRRPFPRRSWLRPARLQQW